MLKKYLNKDLIEAGIDETGKGPLSGPVVTAAVILPKDFESELIIDSKKLNAKKLKEAYDLIIVNALAYSVQATPVSFIDEYGIDEAIYHTMDKCIYDLKITPEHLLIDGNRWGGKSIIPHTCVIKGDNTYLNIAAASILAKVRRDEYMVKIGELYPKYGWASNKGYGSKAHIEALKEFGPTRYHRKQFIRNFV
jgi:ribonuclease HII